MIMKLLTIASLKQKKCISIIFGRDTSQKNF